MSIGNRVPRWGAAFVAIAIQSQILAAAEIRVVATSGVSALMPDVATAFERTTGHKLVIRYGLIPFQQQQIATGDFDLAIVPSNVLDAGVQSHNIAADTRTLLARVRLAVGFRAGGLKPDIGSVEAFRRAMLNATSVSYVTSESAGMTVTKGFERLGIADQMRAKTKAQESVARVWQAVAKGEADLGFGLTSNVLAVPGVEVAGLLPPELQYTIVIAAGIGATARDAGAARNFVEFLQSPSARSAMKARGLEPEAQ